MCRRDPFRWKFRVSASCAPAVHQVVLPRMIALARSTEAHLPRLDTTPALSAHMRRIRKTDTKPELIVRRLTHAMGFRYRLHRRDLPGTPDLVFPARRKVIFVHGCFWHQHDCRLGSKQPSANRHYWAPKLARNVQRDEENQAKLHAAGWSVLVIWECEMTDTARVAARISSFLKSSSGSGQAVCQAAAAPHGQS